MKSIPCFLISILTAIAVVACGSAAQAVPIHVTYLWHMHQPIYYPYESPGTIDANNRFTFSVQGVWDGDRFNAYRNWPKDAVQQSADRNMAHGGAQVSYSGSLAENNKNLWGDYSSWAGNYRWARNGLRTGLNNPRLDVVGIPYHHSLMPLTCKESMKMQIRLHKEQYAEVWDTGGAYSKGFWPPECAFAENMIPALVEEGMQWVIVDNGHLFRTVPDFPWSDASSCRPNPADQINPSASQLNSEWVQLNNIWAPTKVLAPWSYQPHYVQQVNPWDGSVQKIIAVPAGRYEGNENGRGGYGSFKPENVWGSHVGNNNNPSKPMLILCHSDGDNYGMKNSEAWNKQFGDFLSMCQNNGDFEFTSVQDYLGLYPPNATDVIHVEPGSWVGIDGGTPYFDKWLSYENRSGEMPDMWSWSVLVAAQNRVILADSLEGGYSMNDVEWGIGSDTAKAWHYYLNGETSCYWYWDFDRANPWDGNPTRACNMAVESANKVIGRHAGTDNKGPSIFPPQRTCPTSDGKERVCHNPGGYMWNASSPDPSDFDVWSFVYDVSELQAGGVKLYWRTDKDGLNPISSVQNETYAGGNEVNAWNTLTMTASWWPSLKGPANIVPDPSCRAQRFTARLAGQNNVFVDYFVEAIDTKGNVSRSDIQHVFVGASNTNTPQPYVSFDPSAPNGCHPVTVKYKKSGSPLGAGQVYLHIGRNNWQGVLDPDPAMTDGGDYWTYTYTLPAGTHEIDCAFRNASGTWDSNGGADYKVAVANCGGSVGPAVQFSADPSDCAPLTVTYTASNRPLSGKAAVYMMLQLPPQTNWVDHLMTSLYPDVWQVAVTPANNSTSALCTFHDGASSGRVWDGQDYTTAVRHCSSGTNASAVVFDPASPNGCENVTITYQPNDGDLRAAHPVYIHIGRNNWKDLASSDPAMTALSNGNWSYTYTPPPGTYEINCCFTDGGSVWDNHSKQDWKVAVAGCSNINGLLILTPAGDVEVGAATSNHLVAGVADASLAGQLTWSNALTGGHGQIPAGTTWSVSSVPLGPGVNVITVSGTNQPATVSTGGYDNAAAAIYNDGWQDGDNGGSGFTGWTLYRDTTNQDLAGQFLSSDNTNCNIGAKAWGLYANSDKLSEAKRPFAGTLAVGQKFFVRMDNGHIDQGRGIGIALQNAAGGTLWQFFFNGGDTNYNLTGASTSIGWTRAGLELEFTLTATDTYSVVITPYGSSTLTYSGHLESLADKGIKQFRAWNYAAGSGEAANFYLNDLTLLQVAAGAGSRFSDTVNVTRLSSFLDSDGDGIDDDWERLQFNNLLTTADANSDWDGDGALDGQEWLANTDPKDKNSCFRLQSMVGGSTLGNVITWQSVAGKRYMILGSTNLLQGFAPLQSNLLATPPANVWTDTLSGVMLRFYQVKTTRE